MYETPLVAFLEEDFASKVPFEWFDALSVDSLDLNHLLDLNSSSPAFKAFPTSLQHYLETCKALAMPRERKNIDSLISHLPPSTGPLLTELDPYLCIGMKPKKIHEVLSLTNAIHQLCGPIKNVVDVGSGKGYIAQALSHHYAMHVIGLEGNPNQHEKAVARFEVTEKNRARGKPRKEQASPSGSDAVTPLPQPRLHSTVNYMLDFGLQPTTLDAMVQHELLDKKICLMSLHACGDLSPIILELFRKWDRAKTLVNVACCYHKMTLEHIDAKRSLPMSRLVSDAIGAMDLAPHLLWLDLATHAPLQWQAMTPAQLEVRLNKLAFRAVLQVSLRSIFSEIAELRDEYGKCLLHVQKLRADAVFENLGNYLAAALPRLKIKKSGTGDEAIPAAKCIPNWTRIQEQAMERSSEVYQQYRPLRRKMAIVLALLSCLAPVAESLVILDRWAYLEEYNMDTPSASATSSDPSPAAANPHSSLDPPAADLSQSPSIVPWIVPIFDQEESPRNLALIAVKSTLNS